MTTRRASLALALAMASAVPDGAAARQGSDAYGDETARAIHGAAMEARGRYDDSLVRYTALVRQRIGAALRTPLKDRTLYRRESAHRLFWSRDGEDVVQVLGLRETSPLGFDEIEEEILDDIDGFEDRFDPMDDRLLFGLVEEDEDFGEPGDDDFWFEHPLDPVNVGVYHFSSGDTLTLSLPDGRRVVAIELRVVPRVADVHRMTGSLWIEPGSGSIVRAVYRLSDTLDAFRDIPDLREEEDDDLRFVPGLLKPWTFELSIVAVDYALWDFDVWMPRSMRMEGVVRAGILKAPVTADFSYEIESVVTERSLAVDGPEPSVPEVRFDTRGEAMAYLRDMAAGASEVEVGELWSRSDGKRTRYLYPSDPEALASSPDLPPPIWEDAPGFASGDDIAEMFDGLADLPVMQPAQVPTTFRWGLQRPDLVRYNRVEALSLGVRGQVRPRTFVGPLSVSATARVGAADRHPNVRVEAAREDLRRRVTLAAYHELAATEEDARHLGLGNTLMAMLFGRDDGDYYRRSGASLVWTPPVSKRASFRLRAYSEYHRIAGRATDFALFRLWNGDFAFRPALTALEGWEHGLRVELSPWWGTDPDRAQGGVDLVVQGGAGATEYARGSALGRLVVPLPGALRLGAGLGAGSSLGSPAPQRLWSVGGSRSLRGYDPRRLVGTAFVRGRGELARHLPFGSVSVFYDVGWAGDRSDVRLGDALRSVGAGVSLLDGLIRVDGARGLDAPRRFRLDVYLDAML